jgi:hypothetical protein
MNFLCVVLNFLTKMYVQSMYMKCITNLILDLALMSTDSPQDYQFYCLLQDGATVAGSCIPIRVSEDVGLCSYSAKMTD